MFGLFDNCGRKRPAERRCYVGAQPMHDRRNWRLRLPIHEKKPDLKIAQKGSDRQRKRIAMIPRLVIGSPKKRGTYE